MTEDWAYAGKPTTPDDDDGAWDFLDNDATGFTSFRIQMLFIADTGTLSSGETATWTAAAVIQNDSGTPTGDPEYFQGFNGTFERRTNLYPDAPGPGQSFSCNLSHTASAVTFSGMDVIVNAWENHLVDAGVTYTAAKVIGTWETVNTGQAGDIRYTASGVGWISPDDDGQARPYEYTAFTVASDTVTTTDATNNNPPSVTITSPTNGTIVDEGDSITYSATATDPEDGDVGPSLTWSSDVDGLVGTSASFVNAGLSVATHTIAATATDSEGLEGYDEVIVVVNEVDPDGTCIVTKTYNGIVYFIDTCIDVTFSTYTLGRPPGFD